MEPTIILLRGVMPTGRNRVPMAPLREALEAAGLRDVRSWIQSGNVIATTRRTPASTAKLVREVIAREFGGDITVYAQRAGVVREALARNPFTDVDPGRVYFTFLCDPPAPQLLAGLLAIDFAPDRIVAIDGVLYLALATQASQTRLTNSLIERRLKVATTTRVHNTVAKLVAMVDAG